MSCTITPHTDPAVKIDILMGNAALNRFRKDQYGMTVCKIGYEYSYLADLKFLLERTTCAESSLYCVCNCSSVKVKEKINTL